MQTPKPTGKIRAVDPGLIDALRPWAEKLGSNAKLASQLGVSPTYVSRVFSGSFSGNVEEFEGKAKAFLQLQSKARREPLQQLAPTGFLVEPMRDFLTTVAHTGDIGVAWSDAGKGKTCGIDVYLQDEPNAIKVTALKSRGGWRALRDAILDELPQKRRQKHESWNAYLCRIFRGSKRLLIVDNAHLLTDGARQWLAYDWHGETGCPVALVGNPEIVAAWSRNDQQESRVGIAYEIKARSTAADVARDTFALLMPGVTIDAETLRLATKIVRGKGAVRALRKHALLTAELIKNPQYQNTPLPETFKAAHHLLLNQVNLDTAN